MKSKCQLGQIEACPTKEVRPRTPSRKVEIFPSIFWEYESTHFELLYIKNLGHSDFG